MIAAADKKAIEDFHHRTKGELDSFRFHQFPTRVNNKLFFPMKIQEARKKIGLPKKSQIFVVTGRLCWIKGWDFLLRAFVHIKKKYPNATLIFVGDGEDHSNVLDMGRALGIQKQIKITGFIPQSEVVLYLNSADVCLVGSHREGWSLAMCEMLACGKPIVTTDVSGANDMIQNGQNGYIVKERNPRIYADAVIKSVSLENAFSSSLKISQKYAVETLSKDLGLLWGPLGENG